MQNQRIMKHSNETASLSDQTKTEFCDKFAVFELQRHISLIPLMFHFPI